MSKKTLTQEEKKVKNNIKKIKNMTESEAKNAVEFIQNFQKVNIDQLRQETEKRIEEMNLDDMTVKDILYMEFKNWSLDLSEDSVNSNNNLYMVRSIINYLCEYVTPEKLNRRPSYDEVLTFIKDKLALNKKTTKDVLAYIIKNADFSKSIFLPSLAKMDREYIKPEFLLGQILDYTYDETE